MISIRVAERSKYLFTRFATQIGTKKTLLICGLKYSKIFLEGREQAAHLSRSNQKPGVTEIFAPHLHYDICYGQLR